VEGRLGDAAIPDRAVVMIDLRATERFAACAPLIHDRTRTSSHIPAEEASVNGSFRTRGTAARPPSFTRSTAIAVWVFAVVEAIGIGIALWRYS
jgi:hypothetical protein